MGNNESCMTNDDLTIEHEAIFNGLYEEEEGDVYAIKIEHVIGDLFLRYRPHLFANNPKFTEIYVMFVKGNMYNFHLRKEDSVY